MFNLASLGLKPYILYTYIMPFKLQSLLWSLSMHSSMCCCCFWFPLNLIKLQGFTSYEWQFCISAAWLKISIRLESFFHTSSTQLYGLVLKLTMWYCWSLLSIIQLQCTGVPLFTATAVLVVYTVVHWMNGHYMSRAHLPVHLQF